jgi:kynurenine formamidase
MSLKQSIAGGLALVFVALANAQMIDPTKIVDLTYPFDGSTIYWPGEPRFEHQYEKYGKTPEGYFYSSARYAAPEHGGTHMDAPIHFNQGGVSAENVPLADCVGPAAVIDFSERAAKDRDATLGVGDIQKYEAINGKITSGAIVVARSGWGRWWPDRKHYLGTERDDASDLHFPGFSPEAIQFLLESRKPVAIAIDTASIDAGQAKKFPVHVLWLGSNHPAFENLANADRLPAKGATLFCIPMKIAGGTGGPTRIFAVLP